MDMREVMAMHLRVGQWFVGRGDWLIKAEEVKVNPCGGLTRVKGVNCFGEEVNYRYRASDKVMIFQGEP